MADQKHLEILLQGVEAWNEWKRIPGNATPDLSSADLNNEDLSGAELWGANLINANLSGANLSHADVSLANLSRANLSRANLSYADLSGADLSYADLSGANLDSVTFLETALSGTRFYNSAIAYTRFGDLDLRGAEGLETTTHGGPSEISISTIYRSEGEIPEAFLIGCGVPKDFVTYMRSLVGKAIEFYSCFISYSSKDEEFARRLHARMRQEGLRVWFAPEDMKGGDYFSDQIDRAIQFHDRLLLVLSENSIASNWVIREIKRTRKAEEREGRKKLFPISLTNYEVLRGWECLDHDSGIDLAEEVRRFHIPNFSNWKDHHDFEREFIRLYESLKAEA
jgi:hypothetical protein